MIPFFPAKPWKKRSI